MVQQISYWRVLTRRKVLGNEGADGESKLNRVLGLCDLTALGVGSTLGAGVYVLAGQIAKDQAGPSVIISFIIAALASLLAGVCYAEFGARVPKAGSAYVYSYVCIGEFVAFVIGWNLMLEYIVGTASVCRGISLYLDTLINDTLKHTFAEIAPMNVSFLGSYFDFFAFALVVVFGVALAFGVESSAIANNFCTCLNICILLFVIIAGSIKANFSNWHIDVSTVNATDVNLGSGGFFPFGFTGTLKGAATCFFGFVGFDCIATTGEEVRNPRKNIPRSILLSLLIIFLCYFGVSTVLTLMVPYYQQDPNAPLPYAFKEVGWDFAMWIVAIGGLIGLLASLFGALFPLPRVMYSMAQDGLLFRFLGKVSPRFQVPVVGSIFAAIMTALIAGVFDLNQLVNLLSIGTLLAYSVVAISVTILRYMDNAEESDHETSTQSPTESTLLTSAGIRFSCGSVLVQLFNFRRVHTPNVISTRIVGTLITIFCVLSLGIGLIFTRAYDALVLKEIWVLTLLGILVSLTFFVLLSMCLQPREAYTRLFRVPFVPIVPAVSIFINIYLMLQLDVMTWVRFGIWMIIGLPMFIACWCKYDIKNPAKRNPERIAFIKALRERSAPANGKSTNGHAKINIMNGSILSTKSKNSAKSLDEIKNMNECDELVECKHPNGKVFYVEESKQSSSNTASRSGSVPNDAQPKTNTAQDEEKTAIAMLDDVLKAEDDDAGVNGAMIPLKTQSTHHYGHPEYSRKISVDSEMLPSVIETTIVATVHSSDSSDYNDLDESAEIEHELNRPTTDEYLEKKAVAENFIDELFNSPDLWQTIEQRRTLRELEMSLKTIIAQKSATKNSPATSIAHTPNYKINSPASGSLRSGASTIDEDAIHSEKFKLRLSQLIMQPPIPIGNKINPTESIADNTALKPSKSENDLQQMPSAVVETPNNNALTTIDRNTNEQLESIPRPPKFDPVLYNTINSLKFNRERPSLAKLLNKDKERKSIGIVITPQPTVKEKVGQELSPVDEEQKSEVPFKEKLEAILRRGPSHYSQKRQDIILPRAKSMEPIALTLMGGASDEYNNPGNEPKVTTPIAETKSESNLYAIAINKQINKMNEAKKRSHQFSASKSMREIKSAANNKPF